MQCLGRSDPRNSGPGRAPRFCMRLLDVLTQWAAHRTAAAPWQTRFMASIHSMSETIATKAAALTYTVDIISVLSTVCHAEVSHLIEADDRKSRMHCIDFQALLGLIGEISPLFCSLIFARCRLCP